MIFNRIRISSAILTVGVILGLAYWAVSNRHPENLDYRFVRTTLLVGELAGREKRVARWVHPATVTLVNGDARYRDYVESIVSDLNRSVDGLTVSFVESPTAAIRIRFVPQAVLRRMLEKSGVKFRPRRHTGYFRRGWKRDWEVAAAVIFVDATLNELETKRTLLQELIQTLGPIGDSPTHPDSAMYETKSALSSTTALAPIDRKLLRFLYRYLKPGDDEAAVRVAFDKYWDTIPSD